MGHFGAEVYFIFIRGASGPLCKWLRERMGIFYEMCNKIYTNPHKNQSGVILGHCVSG